MADSTLERWREASQQQRLFQWVQPRLIRLIDGTVSTLAPVFSAAYISGSRAGLLVGVAVPRNRGWLGGEAVSRPKSPAVGAFQPHIVWKATTGPSPLGTYPTCPSVRRRQRVHGGDDMLPVAWLVVVPAIASALLMLV